MGIKVVTSTEYIGDPVEKYSSNHDISPNQPLYIKGEKEIRLLLDGKNTDSRKQSVYVSLDGEI